MFFTPGEVTKAIKLNIYKVLHQKKKMKLHLYSAAEHINHLLLHLLYLYQYTPAEIIIDLDLR